MNNRLCLCLVVPCLFVASLALADPWPQFRGPNGSGVSLEKQSLPAEIAPDKNVLWSRTLPPGVSSPVIFGQRMYLTAHRENNQLVTLAINTADGEIVWEQ